jgi:alginate O-acetyltransferase complex protein AlgI
MVLGGLWHGAAWSYAIWGAFHGLALAIERVFDKNLKVRIDSFIGKCIKGAVVFLFVTLAWLLFKLPFEHVTLYIKSVTINRHQGIDYTILVGIALYSVPVIVYHLLYLIPPTWKLMVAFKRYESIVYALLLFMICVNSGPSGSFIYFQF